MNGPGYLTAFTVGFLSFLAPCTLPVLPGYLSYLAGVHHKENGRQKRLRVFITSLAFVTGFLLFLVILGATASLAGQILLKNKKLWQKIGGLLIIIFGLQTIGFLKLSFLEKGKNWHLEKLVSVRHGKAFFAGVSFAIGWTPCIGPILGSILILASQTKTLNQGIGLLTFYALGLGIPMLLAGFFLSQLKFLKSPYVPLISGGILIILGLLLFFGQYSKLTVWTSEIYRFLKIPIY